MQTARQWMVTHEWMTKGNRQTEWIEKRGILMWLAEYSGGLGSGAFIVSLFFNSFWGMVAAFLIVVGLKGGLHMLFLGKPIRFWRMVLHPQTSWMSRGLLFVVLFMGFAFLQLVLMAFVPEQAATAIIVLKVISGLLALCVGFYTGFVMNNAKGVPFWNLPFLPLIFIADGILGGFGLIVAFGLFIPGINLAAAETGSRIFLVLDIVLVALYLFLASKKDAVGIQSVLFQIKGQISPIFWTCVVTLGMVVPILIAVASIFTGELTPLVLIFGVICEAIGQVMFKYCFLKSGMYNPIELKKA